MTYESPVPEWVVGSHGNSQRTSLWLSEVMTNYPDPIHQLVVELNVLSKTSRGRALFSRLQDANVTVPGAISLFEVAQGLEWNPRIEPTPSLVLERLVTLSFRDQDTTLTLLVALRRALREMAFSIGRLSSDPDVVPEILVDLLAELANSGDTESVGVLLDRTYRSARRTLRRQDRQSAPEVPWEFGDDFEEVTNDVGDSDLLERFVRSGTTSSPDADLIRLTRIEGLSLAEVSNARSANYQTVKRRRNRAETVIRRLLREEGES
jgi:DNA-directed RNA polymerase specialized sigma24 family protein